MLRNAFQRAVTAVTLLATVLSSAQADQALGCVAISSTFEKSTSLNPNSPQTCRTECVNQGFTYYAVTEQFCMCSSSEPTVSQTYPDTACGFACQAPYQAEACGGEDPSTFAFIYNLFAADSGATSVSTSAPSTSPTASSTTSTTTTITLSGNTLSTSTVDDIVFVSTVECDCTDEATPGIAPFAVVTSTIEVLETVSCSEGETTCSSSIARSTPSVRTTTTDSTVVTPSSDVPSTVPLPASSPLSFPFSSSSSASSSFPSSSSNSSSTTTTNPSRSSTSNNPQQSSDHPLSTSTPSTSISASASSAMAAGGGAPLRLQGQTAAHTQNDFSSQPSSTTSASSLSSLPTAIPSLLPSSSVRSNSSLRPSSSSVFNPGSTWSSLPDPFSGLSSSSSSSSSASPLSLLSAASSTSRTYAATVTTDVLITVVPLSTAVPSTLSLVPLSHATIVPPPVYVNSSSTTLVPVPAPPAPSGFRPKVAVVPSAAPAVPPTSSGNSQPPAVVVTAAGLSVFDQVPLLNNVWYVFVLAATVAFVLW
ncbi:Carbohydrate-binding WSC [Niveomyces insectorum RCEF 264]|uniref:Carbohydrate-binding WSC n=1 Tax=Niveomyces insectorum RCEF 264 TaxID=1081102 RepID=A0A167SEY5_9HYPO|nr:Carbohydrate-binding WSC [Niveomyces insectorum RCEF 264]